MRKLTNIGIGIFIVLASFVFALGQDTPRVIKGGVLNGKAVSLPKPEYPLEAKKGGLEGRVVVDVEIDESGAVVSAKATGPNEKPAASENADEPPPSPGELALRGAAERAAFEARFPPTLLSGVPVRVVGKIVYNFVLSPREGGSVNGGILNSRASSLPAPVYPDAAKAVRASGTVVVKITIDENGDVVEAAAVSGHPLLRSAAVEAAREAKFAPTMLSGQPVKVSGMLTYNFELPD